MNKRIKIGFGILGAAILLSGLSAILSHHSKTSLTNPPAIPAKKPLVVASFYPLYFFASEIVGDKATVYNVTPAAAEPHDYEPTSQDIARIEDSQLLILSGGKLEPWGDQIKNNLKDKSTIVITVGDPLSNQNVVEDGKTVLDPHVWQDPLLVKKEVALILQGLGTIDSADNNYFAKNAATLDAKLDVLDQEYRAGLKYCQKKDIITSHAAFGYLASEYGLNQVAISGLSPDAEPSPKKLSEIADFAKKNSIKYIFFESLVSPKLSQTVAEEIGAETLVLNPIEGLTNEEIASGKNYFTEMRSNLVNLKTALECP